MSCRNCRARDRNNTDCGEKKNNYVRAWFIPGCPHEIRSPEGCRYNCLKAFMEQFSPFCSQSPWQAVTTIFSGGPSAALPNYFLKSVKIFFFSLTHGGRDEGVIFGLMFHFSQRKRTDNMKLTQNKAQKSLCCWTKWALTFVHTHTHKKEL